MQYKQKKTKSSKSSEVKQQQQQHVEEWKLYSRENMKENAEEKRKVPKLHYITTFQSKSDIASYVQEHGNILKVYIVQLWIDGYRLDQETKVVICPHCLYLIKQKSFIEKWVWNEKKKWHLSAYVHKSEIIKK